MTDPQPESDPDLAVPVPARERETLPPPAPSDTERSEPPTDELTLKHVAQLLEIVRGIDQRNERFERNWHEAEARKAKYQDAHNKQVLLELAQINTRLEIGNKRMDGFEEADRFQTGEINTLREEVSIARMESAPTPKPAPGDGRTVLLVEDYPEYRNLVARRLEECGMRVLRAGSLDAAYAALGRELPDVGVIDLMLRGEDAMPLVRTIRRDYPGVAVIILTGVSGHAVRAEAEALGALFFRKPIGLTVLVDAIRDAQGAGVDR